VEYVWTQNGAAPVSLPHGPLDYDHYALSQIFPVAHSIAAAAHWDAAALMPRRQGPGRFEAPGGQLELDLQPPGSH
jgi:DNA polymerase-2